MSGTSHAAKMESDPSIHDGKAIGPALIARPEPGTLHGATEDRSLSRTLSASGSDHTTSSGNLEGLTNVVGLSKVWKPPALPRRGRKPKIGAAGIVRKTASSGPRERPRRRGALPLAVRASAALKRQQKSVCVICHFKKETCQTGSAAQDGPCVRCRLFQMPCIRYHIADASLYREQEAPYWVFSQRWKKMELRDITRWASSEVRTVEISLSLLHAPYKARVRRFIPEPGDMTAERWTRDGEVVRYPLPPYGIADMEETARSIEKMIEREAGTYIANVVGGGPLGRNCLVWETYFAAFKRASTAPTIQEQRLLFDTLRLWVMCRVTSNFEHIVGEDKLGIDPVDDPSCPFNGSVPITGVMTAQLECIYYARFLRPLSKTVLQTLMQLIKTKERRYWYTIFLALFMLLHSSSMITRRDMEYAATLGLQVPFCNPESIKQHNAGSTTLLAHYHQVLSGSAPFQLALQNKLPDMATLGLTQKEDVIFITRSARMADHLRPKWDRIRQEGSWENDYFWISQLYDDNWRPEKMD